MRYKQKRFYAWSADMAYIVGLITADGCLSGDHRHIVFTSKDRQLAEVFRDLIRPGCMIGTKSDGSGRRYFRVQFSDVALYDFLLNAGLMPCKSKILEKVDVPSIFFADFVRGCFDGDGSVYSYMDKRWRSSFMFYTTFASASPPFLRWLKATVTAHFEIEGHIKPSARAESLWYAKKDSRRLFSYMYYNDTVPRLLRKYERYLEIFAIDGYPVQR